MNKETWFRLLNLAEEYGWNPLGPVSLDWWLQPEPVQDGYDPYESGGWSGKDSGALGRLVLLEDALNLGDALEAAFLEYEPERVQEIAGFAQTGMPQLQDHDRPSIGVIAAVIDFCRMGAFLIERS